MKNQESAISIQNLTKYYGKHKAVDGLSLNVERGDIFGFLGPNGAGKSTTIRSLLGLIAFQEGEAEILGMDVKTHHREILGKIGYMPSEAMFYPSMKVKEVIRFAADMRKLDCTAEAQMLCERLQVDQNKRIEELSLGNRKKVSIVCAMQHKPELFIFDEPTSGLDPLMQAEFFKLIMEYNKQGTTCFLSSHVLSEIKKYCKHAAIIREGKLICTDTVENLTRTNTKRIRMIRDGKEEDFVFKGDLNQLFAGFAGHNIEDIVIEEPELDEIFMHYYEEEAK
ncbi:MAG: ABC transporter ATP-binding protein [Lachnospiraceae bacterium]|nr:ABC transporter ATP-binding protein [Lachnospiraceae bacterium]MDD7628833.1 ABC transporter ATP-binding protein [Lachnospiraceae bacterium]MDY4120328.1 ABC transporter ATP-binding protein [Lachnospiraceae bacterium]